MDTTPVVGPGAAPADESRAGEKMKRAMDKSLGTVESLSKLLPTGTTMAFQTMAPSFTKGGQCHGHDVNFAFTWGLIGFLTLLCAVLSFTDSVTDKHGHTYYGIATPMGFKLFNHDLRNLDLADESSSTLKKRMRMGPRDLLHAVVSAAVFVALALCDAGVQRCLVPEESRTWKDFLNDLPLAVGFLASFLLIIFPSTRKGIGEDDGTSNDNKSNSKRSRRLLDKSMGTVAGLTKLLPTGTTLAFQTMAPSFANGGMCKNDSVNFGFTWALIGFLTVLCAALSFTDSVVGKDGSVYYGLATPNGLWLFDKPADEDWWEDIAEKMKWEERKRMKRRDWLHAALGAAVFLTVAFCDAGVQGCLVPKESWQWREFLNLLPLAVGFLASFVFIIFPSKRHGIGKPGAGWDAQQEDAPEEAAQAKSSTSDSDPSH